MDYPCKGLVGEVTLVFVVEGKLLYDLVLRYAGLLSFGERTN